MNGGDKMSDLGNREVFAENLQYYMHLYDISRKEICDLLGFRYTTFTGWVTGQKYPRIDKIEILANFFGISKADLIEKKNPSQKKSDELLRKIMSFDDDDLQRISEYIDLLHLRHQKKQNETDK